MNDSRDIVSCRPCQVQVRIDRGPIPEEGITCPVCWRRLVWNEGPGIHLADNVSLTTGLNHESRRIIHRTRAETPDTN